MQHAPKQELISEFYNHPIAAVGRMSLTSTPALASAKQLGEVASHEMIVEIHGPARMKGVPRKKWP